MYNFSENDGAGTVNELKNMTLKLLLQQFFFHKKTRKSGPEGVFKVNFFICIYNESVKKKFTPP